MGRRLTLWRVPWYTFPGFPRPTKSHGFRAPPSPAPAANEEAARQAEEEAGTHLGLARVSDRSGEGRRDAEAPGSSRIAVAAAAAAADYELSTGNVLGEGRRDGPKLSYWARAYLDLGWPA